MSLVRPRSRDSAGDTNAPEPDGRDPFEALGVVSLEDLTEWVKVLVVGYTGAGKTRMAASAAAVEAMRPVLFINCEAGTMSIPLEYPIDTVRVTDADTVMKLAVALRNAHGRYKTIIIDDGVEFCRIIMGGVMKEQVAAGGHDPDIPNRADYLRLQERVRTLIRFFRDYPAHFIMTAKAKDREEESGAISTVPGLPGVLAIELPGYFDVVGFMESTREKNEDEVKRRFIVMPSKKLQWVKDRTDQSGRRSAIESPTMQQVLNNFLKRRKLDA
jgi:hypothetical protein